MQRYNELYDPYTGALELDNDGAYVLYEEAQAEIDALHTECDRLTALLGKPKVLEAHEVTEPGFYWTKFCNQYHIVELCKCGDSFEVYMTGDSWPQPFAGQFVGPLKQPEV